MPPKLEIVLWDTQDFIIGLQIMKNVNKVNKFFVAPLNPAALGPCLLCLCSEYSPDSNHVYCTFPVLGSTFRSGVSVQCYYSDQCKINSNFIKRMNVTETFINNHFIFSSLECKLY